MVHKRSNSALPKESPLVQNKVITTNTISPPMEPKYTPEKIENNSKPVIKLEDSPNSQNLTKKSPDLTDVNNPFLTDNDEDEDDAEKVKEKQKSKSVSPPKIKKEAPPSPQDKSKRIYVNIEEYDTKKLIILY
jgi:hypothetical protein